MRVLIRHRDAGSRKLMERLRQILPEMQFVDWDRDEPRPDAHGCEVLLAVGPVNREDIGSGPFRLIQSIGTGFEQIDLAAAREREIPVAHCPAGETGNAESVAEMAILQLLALLRRLDEARQALREGRWTQPAGAALYRKTVCVVGLGAVGRATVERLTPFGVRVLGVRKDAAKGAPAGVELGPLGDALPQADAVLLCARPDGQVILDRGMIARMKRGAVVINVARGSLVDAEALTDALRSGQLGGAGLDVFGEEPVDPRLPLLQLPHVIATPHVAGVTDVNLSGILELVAENLRRVRRGEDALYLVAQVRT